jgi:hypothetical protein
MLEGPQPTERGVVGAPGQGSPTGWPGGMSIASPPYRSSRQDPASTPARNLPVGLARLVSADRRGEHATGAAHGQGPFGPRIAGLVAVTLAGMRGGPARRPVFGPTKCGLAGRHSRPSRGASAARVRRCHTAPRRSARWPPRAAITPGRRSASAAATPACTSPCPAVRIPWSSDENGGHAAHRPARRGAPHGPTGRMARPRWVVGPWDAHQT